MVMSSDDDDNFKMKYEYEKYIRNKEYSFKLNLAKIRKQNGLSQKDISKKTGLKQQAISRLEKDIKISPGLETLIKYVDSLGYEITLTKKSITQELLDNFFDEVKF